MGPFRCSHDAAKMQSQTFYSNGSQSFFEHFRTTKCLPSAATEFFYTDAAYNEFDKQARGRYRIYASAPWLEAGLLSHCMMRRQAKLTKNILESNHSDQAEVPVMQVLARASLALSGTRQSTALVAEAVFAR